jgi:hypothetical protein
MLKRHLSSVFNRYGLLISIIIIVTTFVITRMLFYLKYPMPVISQDTSSYLKPALSLLNKEVPIFDNRTPGYPLFLFISLAATPYLVLIVAFQTTIALFASISTIIGAHSLKRYLSIPTAIAMSAYSSIAINIKQEFGICTDSLYGSFLLIFTSFLMLSLARNRRLYWFLCSFSMGCVIYIRPTGLFLLIPYLIIS